MQMQNQENFADRLRHIEGRKTVPVTHAMVVSHLVDTKRKKSHVVKKRRSYLGLNICMILVLVTLGFRAATMTAGIDLEQRRAQLADGNEQQRIAGYLVQAAMLADPLLISVLKLRKS